MLQNTWVEKRREERPSEFAPPSTYDSGRSSTKGMREKRRPEKTTTTTGPPIPPRPEALEPEEHSQATGTISEESIVAGLAFFKQMTCPVSPQRKEPERAVVEDSSDDDLLPPGVESFPEQRGAAIPPPASMDYYTFPSSSSKSAGRNQPKLDLTESFRQGLENRRK